ELQAELHRRIEEALDRAERHRQPLGDAAERKPDLEAILGHHQVPELVLQDDGHLVRILREQARRELHALGLGNEGDEEMVLARQTMWGGVVQALAQHAAKRVARKYIITNMIGRHYRSHRIRPRRAITPDSPLWSHGTPPEA